MNNQQAFDRMCDHLMTQKAQAYQNGYCVFRTAQGLQCAIGCLIPDQVYHPNIEGMTVRSLKARYPDFAAIVADVDTYLLDECQYVHDRHEVPQWASELRKLAQKFELEAPASIG